MLYMCTHGPCAVCYYKSAQQRKAPERKKLHREQRAGARGPKIRNPGTRKQAGAASEIEIEGLR
jgi:hypothetical protein